MLELFKNAAKIKQLFDEKKYMKAVGLLAKTLAALVNEFDEGDEGQPVMKAAKRTTAADAKNLEKAEATLAGIHRPAVGATSTDATGAPAGGAGLTIFLTLLPIVLDFLRRRRERQG